MDYNGIQTAVMWLNECTLEENLIPYGAISWTIISIGKYLPILTVKTKQQKIKTLEENICLHFFKDAFQINSGLSNTDEIWKTQQLLGLYGKPYRN